MFALGNATFACGVRNARKRPFEEACGEMEVGSGLPASTAAAGAGAADMPPGCKQNLNLKQQPPQALFCLKLDICCCYAGYSCGNNCNVVVKLVQECKFF